MTKRGHQNPSLLKWEKRLKFSNNDDCSCFRWTELLWHWWNSWKWGGGGGGKRQLTVWRYLSNCEDWSSGVWNLRIQVSSWVFCTCQHPQFHRGRRQEDCWGCWLPVSLRIQDPCTQEETLPPMDRQRAIEEDTGCFLLASVCTQAHTHKHTCTHGYTHTHS